MSIVSHYYLYSHWGVGNTNNDIDQYHKEKNRDWWLTQQPVFTYLRAAEKRLEKLLRQTKGVLIIFFDPGWKLALKPSSELERNEPEQLRKATEYSNAVLNSLSGVFLPKRSRVRLVNVTTLDPFIRALGKRDREFIYRWFVGEKGTASYDSPKIVEAFLRARFIGAGLPVFRVDWDVLVNVEKDRSISLGITREALEASLQRDDAERKHLSTRTWVCSAGYRRPNQPTYDEWSRGFATRIQPALLAKPEMCQLVCGTHFGLLEQEVVAPRDVPPVDEITDSCWNWQLAEQFLGVERLADGSWSETHHRFSIAKLGAHPLNAVISGAVLNLSAGAILDLPPFSNMTRGVMWIDDHLKFELHKALGHLRLPIVSCRLPSSVTVVKGRTAPLPNLAAYTWASYLPTLLLGLVMDAWIRREYEDEKDRPLVEALRKAITDGAFDRRTAMQLEKSLREVAIERIQKVHAAWSVLKDGDTHTLASAWATSEVKRQVTAALKDTLPAIRLAEGSRGLGLLADGSRDVLAISDLREPIAQDLRELIWDAVEYIDLTLHWPGMIQTIRAVEEQRILAGLA